MRTSVTLCALALLGLVAIGCSADRPAGSTAHGGRLQIVDSVMLKDSDTLYLSTPGYMAFGANGTLFVSDGYMHRILAYDRNGNPTRVYGRQGSGPGEFSGAGLIVLLGDSILVAVDHMQRKLNRFRIVDGSFLGSGQFAGNGLYSADVQADTVWLGLIGVPDSTGHKAVARWVIGDSIPRFVAAAPHEYTEFTPSPLMVFATARLQVWSDTIAVLYGARNDLTLLDHHGQVLSAIDLPVRERRGVPAERKRMLSRPSPSEIRRLSYETIQSSFSSPRLIRKLTDGSVAIVMADQTVSGTLVTAQLFVTILEPSLRKACVDLPVPVAQDARPALEFRGDTLYLLEQVIQKEQKAVTVLRGYEIDTKGCEWVPVSGAPVG